MYEGELDSNRPRRVELARDVKALRDKYRKYLGYSFLFWAYSTALTCTLAAAAFLPPDMSLSAVVAFVFLAVGAFTQVLPLEEKGRKEAVREMYYVVYWCVADGSITAQESVSLFRELDLEGSEYTTPEPVLDQGPPVEFVHKVLADHDHSGGLTSAAHLYLERSKFIYIDDLYSFKDQASPAHTDDYSVCLEHWLVSDTPLGFRSEYSEVDLFDNPSEYVSDPSEYIGRLAALSLRHGRFHCV